jgi:hypothetical protein
MHLPGLAKYLELRSRVQGNGPRALEVQKLRKACEKRVERCWRTKQNGFKMVSCVFNANIKIRSAFILDMYAEMI